MSGKFLTRFLAGGIAAMFLLPFLWPRHTLPIPSFYNESIAAAALLIACLACIALRACRECRDRHVALPLIGLLFLPLIAVLGVQLSVDQLTFSHNALLPLLVMLCAMASTMLGAAAMRILGAERLLFWICITCLIGGLFNFVVQIIQMVGTGKYVLLWISHSNGSYYGNLAQRNHLATYLSWSLIAVFYLYAKAHLRGYVTVSLALILLTGIALTASRMTWLQIGWIALVGGYLIWQTPLRPRPKFWQLLFALPVFYLIITLAFPHVLHLWDISVGQTAIERLHVNVEELDRNRWLIYSQAWEIFMNHPVWGIGPGELSFNQFLLMDHYSQILFATSAHNLILDLLVTTGLVGFVAVSWFLIAWFCRARKLILSMENICIMLMLAVFGIHALLEFPEWYGFFLFPAAFFMGCLETRFLRLKSSTTLYAFAGGGVFSGLVLCTVLWVQYARLETLYGWSYYYNRGAVPAEGKRLRELLDYRRSSLFKAQAELLVSWNLPLNGIDLNDKLAMSERAMRYQPESNIVYRHVVLLGLSGQQEKALFYLLRLKNTYPDDFNDTHNALIRLAASQPDPFASLVAEASRRGLLQQD